MPARLAINVFSPLPPARTDIANYTVRLLPHLADRADVTVWTAQDSWDTDGLGGVPVRHYAPDTLDHAAVNRADATFYNFGNNHGVHADILAVARKAPGIAVLHDLNYQHFFAGAALAPQGASAYLALMRRHGGAEAEARGRHFLSGTLPIDALVAAHPLTAAFADISTALVVHNPGGVPMLRGQCRLPCHDLPLPYAAGPAPPPRPPPAPPFRIAAFGFIGPNRRLPSVIEALAGPGAPEQFRLDIYGQVDDPAELDGLIARHGLGDRVTRHGYVAEPVLDAALDAADLAVNLRTPTMGEASGSQLRIWSHALPSLVSRIGWYATLPDDAVTFVDPAAEIAGIRDALHRFAQDPAPFRQAGQRGRAVLLARHAPAAVAAALVEIARAAPAQHRLKAAIDLARLSTAHLLDMLPADALPRAAPGVAAAIAELLGAPPQRA